MAAPPAAESLLIYCVKCSTALEVDPSLLVQSSALQAIDSAEYRAPNLPRANQLEEKNAREMVEEFYVVRPDADLLSAKVDDNLRPPGWEKMIQRFAKVFEVASAKCQVDFPICKSCCDQIDEELMQRFRDVENDRDTLRRAFDALLNEPPPPPVDEKEEEALRKQEAALTSRLATVQKQRALLQVEREALESEGRALEQHELRFWDEYQTFSLELQRISDEQQTVNQKIEVATEQLERLKRTNVFDDAFHIYHDGHFGTINGFRLGRLPSQPVDWPEINAGLGQVVLLLQVLCKQNNFQFSKYKLIPLGSFSKIARTDDPTTAYELYGSADINLSKLWWYRRFDTALVYLLDCVREFGEYAHNLDPHFALRYRIQDDMIQGLSVKLQFNQDAKWTKALKYMLSNLKFLLAWTAKHKDH